MYLSRSSQQAELCNQVLQPVAHWLTSDQRGVAGMGETVVKVYLGGNKASSAGPRRASILEILVIYYSAVYLSSWTRLFTSVP